MKKELGFSAEILQMGSTITLVLSLSGTVSSVFPFVGEGNTLYTKRFDGGRWTAFKYFGSTKKVLICGSGISLASSFSNEAVDFYLHEHYLSSASH